MIDPNLLSFGYCYTTPYYTYIFNMIFGQHSVHIYRYLHPQKYESSKQRRNTCIFENIGKGKKSLLDADDYIVGDDDKVSKLMYWKRIWQFSIASGFMSFCSYSTIPFSY